VPNASSARRARREKPPAPTWHTLAQVTDQRRALWNRGSDCTHWVECGRAWDAVAITPLSLGLDVLAAMRLGPRTGYPVLADRLRDTLYVLVPPGAGAVAETAPGIRALSRGDQLLMPCTDHGTPCAHWISPPRKVPPRLVRADRLTAQLQELAPAHERAAAS
jgi:hypothetical protein